MYKTPYNGGVWWFFSGFSNRPAKFTDVLTIRFECIWIFENPFTVEFETLLMEIQVKIIKLMTDNQLKNCFEETRLQ